MKKNNLIFILALFLSLPSMAQEQDTLSRKEERKAKKVWKEEQGKAMFTPLVGPA